MKKLLFLFMLCVFMVTGCEKMPRGQGELIVNTKYAETGDKIEIYPYGFTTGSSIMVSQELSKGRNSVSFLLNADNYKVVMRDLIVKNVQVVEGETVTINIDY